MSLLNFDRANVRFQIFQEIMARTQYPEASRAMAEAIVLTERLLEERAPSANSARKVRANTPRSSAQASRRQA
jgi:hypothetical protein